MLLLDLLVLVVLVLVLLVLLLVDLYVSGVSSINTSLYSSISRNRLYLVFSLYLVY